jgi:hypothetical protein
MKFFEEVRKRASEQGASMEKAFERSAKATSQPHAESSADIYTQA